MGNVELTWITVNCQLLMDNIELTCVIVNGQ